MNRLVLVSALTLSLAGCAGLSNRETNGALLGGAGGAVVGGVATHSVGGALVGGAIGATAGVLIANLTQPHYAHRHCSWSGGHQVCHTW
jgi:outer membrane protein with glycine zipper